MDMYIYYKYTDNVIVHFLFTMYIRYRPSEDLFPIIVSQDCIHEGTSNVIDSYGDKISNIKVSMSCDLCTYMYMYMYILSEYVM